MATTAALVSVTKYCIRYLITSSGDGATLIMTSSGAATPDLVTDTATVLGSPLSRICRTALDAIGPIAAGAATTAQIRTLFLSDGSIVGATSPGVPQAKTTMHVRTGAAAALQFAVDVVAVAGGPAPTIIPSAIAGTGYLDIQIRHSMWF